MPSVPASRQRFRSNRAGRGGALVALALAGSLATAGEGELTPAEFAGAVHVVNFWATWCEPCVRELPVLAEVARSFAGRGVVVVGVSLDAVEDDAGRARVEAFARAHGADFELRFGATARELAAFGLGPGIPATAIVGRDGEVLARFHGEVTRRRLSAAIRRALRDERGPGARRRSATGHEHEHDHVHEHHAAGRHAGRTDAPAPAPATDEASLVPS